MEKEKENETKTQQKVSPQLHQTDPGLWQIGDRSQMERRERFLQEIRKLYHDPEGPGI